MWLICYKKRPLDEICILWYYIPNATDFINTYIQLRFVCLIVVLFYARTLFLCLIKQFLPCILLFHYTKTKYTFKLERSDFHKSIKQCSLRKLRWQFPCLKITNITINYVSLNYHTPAQRSWGGYTGFILPVCPPVDRIVSALYLPQ